MRRSIRLVAVLTAALLPATLAACGDDSDEVVADDPEVTAPDEDTHGTGGTDDPGDPGDPDPDAFVPTEEQINLVNEVMDRTPPEVEGTDDDVAADALEISTLIEGEGPGAAPGDMVIAHYAGVLADGTPFASSWTDDPLEIVLGTGRLISGWEDGLVGARAGERRRLVIGYENAYGADGSPPRIPPEATLVFEIDVVAIIPGDA